MTIKKSLSKTGRSVRVTFTAPIIERADSVHLVGDFNDWDKASHPLKK